MSVFFFGHGDALEHENDGAARGADVDWLVRGVQYQDGLMQGMAVVIMMHAGGEHRRWKVRAHAASEIVYAQ